MKINQPINAKRSRSHAIARSARGETRAWQIGPRVRIGGTIGKLGETIKSHVPSPASMIGGAIVPGGSLIGSALNHSLGSDLAKGATNAGIILGGKALLGKFGSDAAAGGIEGPGGITGGAGADGNGYAWDEQIPGSAGAGSAWDRIKGVLGKAGDFLGGGKMSTLDKILTGAGIASAALDKKHQRDLENKAIDYSTDSYSARQPLRRQGLSMLQSQQTPDLSFLENTANPYTAMHKVIPFNVSAKTPILPNGGSY